MKIKYFYLTFLNIILNIFVSKSQTNAILAIGEKDFLYFKNNKILNNNNLVKSTEKNSSICDYTGKLDLYYNGFNLFDRFNNPVKGWVGININYLQSLSMFRIDKYKVSIFYLYRDTLNTICKIMLSEYDSRLNNGQGGIIPKRHKLFIDCISGNNYASKCYNLIKRLYQNKLIILYQKEEKIKLGIYEFGRDLLIKDSIKILNDFAIPEISNYDSLAFFQTFDYWQGITHSGNSLLIKTRYNLLKKGFLSNVDTLIKNYISIKKINIDKLKLKFTETKVIYLSEYDYKQDTILNEIWSQDFNYEFSPNDSFIYLDNQNFIVKRGNYRSNNLNSSIYQLNLNHNNQYYYDLNFPKFEKKNLFNIFKLMPDGKIYFTDHYWDEFYKKFIIKLNCNETPNEHGNFNYKFDIYPLKIYNADVLYYSPTNRWYDYVKPRPQIDYSCIANVTIKNFSDLSLKMDKFTWYISQTNEEDYEDTITSFEPEIYFTKSGKYPYKVYGYSSAAVYGEWYYDTIDVNIPEKPIANFKASDTTVCRYLPLKFYNFSHAESIKPGTQEKYVWTFGDGSTSNEKEPTHTYTKPGYYTVSLFYSNGYCDSTLVKNQYIHVADAPTPGFVTKQTQGCVPFTAEITDTVKLNVTRKEYLFGDTTGWREITSSQIKHTFTKPGHYGAVQKLYGFTGCVIRTDSVKFYISKGVMPDDSIKITSASFDTLNNLALEWQKHHAAVRYDIYRSPDGTNYNLHSKTSNLNYTDSQNIGLKYYYKVKAIDSCGKATQFCNTASPHIIKAIKQPKNESADISHTHATGLGNAQNIILEYTSNYAKNLAMLEKPFTNPYHDADFAIPGYLQKCYRLQAEHSGIKVYSNLECINYEPIIYIPNSFSPNTDGLNEEFAPVTTGIVSYEIRIYNRWGEEIYKSNKAWKAQNQEAGIYFYNIKFIRNDRQTELHSGVVYLIR